MADEQDERAGVLFAAASYVIWGMLPLYWRLLDNVPSAQIAVHRIFWCAIFVGLLCLVRGRVGRVRGLFCNRKMVFALTVSSLLIAANWTIYIYSIALRHVTEASLGYFLNPLISILLGVVFLREKISKLRLVAVFLAGGAMVLKAVSMGHVPAIALGLAITFGLYGLARKRIPVDPLDGLLVETMLLLPVVTVLMGFFVFSGTGAFGRAPLGTNVLLILAGPITAIPLALFAAGARRIRLSTLGFVQYFSPCITLLIAVAAFGEPFTHFDLMAFGCIWAALVLVALESRLTKRATAPRLPTPSQADKADV